MDKILAILNKAKASVTMWLGAAIVLLGQIEPVATFVGDLVAKVAPGKAVAVTAFVMLLARLRSLITSAQSSLPK